MFFSILRISLAPPPYFFKNKAMCTWFVKEYLYNCKVLLQDVIISDKIPKNNAACLIYERISIILCFITGCNIFGQNPKVQKTRMYGRSLCSFFIWWWCFKLPHIYSDSFNLLFHTNSLIIVKRKKINIPGNLVLIIRIRVLFN